MIRQDTEGQTPWRTLHSGRSIQFTSRQTTFIVTAPTRINHGEIHGDSPKQRAVGPRRRQNGLSNASTTKRAISKDWTFETGRRAGCSAITRWPRSSGSKPRRVGSASSLSDEGNRNVQSSSHRELLLQLRY